MKSRKKSSNKDDEEEVMTLSMDQLILEFDLESSLFSHYHEEYDNFTILSLPRENFHMPRIPITLVGVDLTTLKIHALGYIGHHVKYSITNGIISSIFPPVH